MQVLVSPLYWSEDTWAIAGMAAIVLAIGLLSWWRAEVDAQHQAEAEARAESLLRDILGPADYARLKSLGYLEVPSPSVNGRVYRVPASGGPVVVYNDGSPGELLCVQPTVPLPASEIVLVHKLMIEGCESDYLRLANVLGVLPRARS